MGSDYASQNPESPHDNKGYSEEKCTRCGWVMGNKPLNCKNDDTPHVFPSQHLSPGRRPVVSDVASDEIVARLRYYDEYNDHAPPFFCGRVADHIATLTAEVERLRALIVEWDAAREALLSPPPHWDESDWDMACLRRTDALCSLTEEARRER